MTDLYETLLREEREIVATDFTLQDAWELGSRMRQEAAASGLPIVIGIVLGRQRVFHAALPGSSADNDDWLERKMRVSLRYGRASLAVGESFRVAGKDFDTASRLDPGRFAAHGGVVPIRLAGGVVLGAVGASGLPQREDHAFVIRHLRDQLAARPA